MSYAKKNALIFTAIIISVFALSAFLTLKDFPFKHKYAKVKINSEIVTVELATTVEQRSRGLSGRDGLKEGEGMLFVFDKPDRHGFWMKDMLFSLDMIWIGKNFTVVDITRNAAPESYPEIFRPKNPVKYVLEVSSGWAEDHDIKIGTSVDIY